MREEWVETVREQCAAAATLFFFKQWGGVRKGKFGRSLNGRTYDEMPARGRVEIPSRLVRGEMARSMAGLARGWSGMPMVQIEVA
jgi:hypothetical protein